MVKILPSNAGGVGSNAGQGGKIPHASQHLHQKYIYIHIYIYIYMYIYI